MSRRAFTAAALLVGLTGGDYTPASARDCYRRPTGRPGVKKYRVKRRIRNRIASRSRARNRK